MSQCPCGTCVSCDCGPNPRTDEDGLCVSCGGTSLYIAKLCADGANAVPPHVDPGMEGNQRERILGFIEADPLPIDRAKLLAEVTEGAAKLDLAELAWLAARIRSLRDEIQSPITDAAIDAAVAKADPLAGLPEAERLRILAGAANAMPDNRERFVANSVAAYHARQSGVGVAIGREGQWSPQSTGTHTFGGRLRSDCAPEMLNRAAAEEVLRTTWKLSEATIETMLSHCVVPTSFGEPVDNIVRAHARWLDAQKAAEEPAPRLASREVRYAAVMKVSAEIDAAAEREPQ